MAPAARIALSLPCTCVPSYALHCFGGRLTRACAGMRWKPTFVAAYGTDPCLRHGQWADHRRLRLGHQVRRRRRD
eukprot:5457826-Pleurochrysis_carterae.AAC.2